MIVIRSLAEILLVGTIATKNPVALVKTGGVTKTLVIGDPVEDQTVLGILPNQLVLTSGYNVTILRTGEYLDDDDRLSRGIEVKGDEITFSKDAHRYITEESTAKIVMDATATQVPGGFRIWNFDRGSAYDLAGLKNGDVVTAIDGEQLDSPARAIELLKQVKYRDSFTFTVIRAGMTRTMKVSVKP